MGAVASNNRPRADSLDAILAGALPNLEDQFYCRSRRTAVSVEKCLDDFVWANGLEQRRSACFRCPDGRKVRAAFAGPVELGQPEGEEQMPVEALQQEYDMRNLKGDERRTALLTVLEARVGCDVTPQDVLEELSEEGRALFGFPSGRHLAVLRDLQAIVAEEAGSANGGTLALVVRPQGRRPARFRWTRGAATSPAGAPAGEQPGEPPEDEAAARRRAWAEGFIANVRSRMGDDERALFDRALVNLGCLTWAPPPKAKD